MRSSRSWRSSRPWRPVALILDDLHWADADTLVAIDYLSNRGPLRGVTVAGALRPEDVGGDHRAALLRPTMQIQLEALDEHDLAPLGIDDLYHRTEGHPLFVSLAVAADEEGRRLRSRVGREPLPGRGRSRLPAAERGLPARGVVLGLARSPPSST